MAKIVIAEDDDFLSKIFVEKLNEAGFEVVLVRDGEQALDKLHNEKPDLVILDLIMPKKTGFDVLKEAKASDSTRAVPIIVFSSLSQESDKQKILEMGAADYVVKSDISFAKVLATINKHLPAQAAPSAQESAVQAPVNPENPA